MNNLLILGICLLVLIIIFLIIIIIIGKSKIKSIIVPLELSYQQINELLKQKYLIFKEMINFIKENISIKEDAFKDFIDFNSKECTQSELIEILDKTTKELDIYISDYNESLKNKDFMELKNKLFNIQVNLEATTDYYNNKINLYNKLQSNGPTSFTTKFFEFEEYNTINYEKKEISRVINLN